jgi:hypothetical protein
LQIDDAFGVAQGCLGLGVHSATDEEVEEAGRHDDDGLGQKPGDRGPESRIIKEAAETLPRARGFDAARHTIAVHVGRTPEMRLAVPANEAARRTC